jgi:hypothetical protein
MNLANKTFRNNQTNEVVRVIDSFENIAILEGKQRLDVRDLMNSTLYTEEIDVSSFFNNNSLGDTIANDIRGISESMISDNSNGEISINLGDNNNFKASNENITSVYTEEDERAELARKYGASNDNLSDLEKHNDSFSKLLNNDSEEEEKVVNNKTSAPKQDLNYKQIDEDPISKMFKGIKRTVDFSIDISIDNKIPRIDFIEMMEDSYETSIINFLASEFTDKLLRNPSIIESLIKDKIIKLINDSKKDKVVEKVEAVKRHTAKKTSVKKPVVKKIINKSSLEYLDGVYIDNDIKNYKS